MKTKEEIVNWLVENCVYTTSRGNKVLDLSWLDFSKTDISLVFLTHMKVNGSLDTSCAKVEGNIFQSSQFAKGEIHQNHQTEIKDISQGGNISYEGDIIQCQQEAKKGTISQNTQTANIIYDYDLESPNMIITKAPKDYGYSIYDEETNSLKTIVNTTYKTAKALYHLTRLYPGQTARYLLNKTNEFEEQEQMQEVLNAFIENGCEDSPLEFRDPADN